MSGLPLILVFIVAIIVMIVAISKFKVHPFLAIMGVSLILAVLAGIPFVVQWMQMEIRRRNPIRYRSRLLRNIQFYWYCYYPRRPDWIDS